MKYIAFTTKGLEKIALNEIQSVCSDAQILEIKDKRVLFETECKFKTLSQLKTVDDLGLLISQDINPVSDLDLKLYKELLQSFRDINDTFSLTIGLVATQGVKSSQLLQTIKGIVEQKYSWQFTEFDHSNFDIRIFADHQQFYISVRLTKDSLHHRSYKTVSKEGSIKPTIAAAMVRLVVHKKNLKIVDNFCGSGTILCEALTIGHQVFGGDLNPESVLITKQNLSGLSYESDEKIKPLNATATHWPDHTFDCAISNLPWDKQIQVSSITSLYQDALKEYRRILKPDGGLCLLVSKPELLIKYAKQYFPDKEIKTCPLGLLGQNPTIVVIHNI